MRTNQLFIRVLSALTVAIFIAGGASAQKHGKGGRGGDGDRGEKKHDRGDRSGWGEQKHDRGDRGDRRESSGGERGGWKERGGNDRGHGWDRGGDDGARRQQRQQQVEQWQQQRQHQMEQWRNGQRQQRQQQMDQWQNGQRHQQRQQQMEQFRNAQRQQWEAARQQQRQWRDAQRQQRGWQDNERRQRREWSDSPREDRRAAWQARKEQQRQWKAERHQARDEWKSERHRVRDDWKSRRDEWQQARQQRDHFRSMRQRRDSPVPSDWFGGIRGDAPRVRRDSDDFPRLNWRNSFGERARDRAFETERMRDAFRTRQYADGGLLRQFRRPQQFENDYYQRSDRYAGRNSYDARPEIWFGDDYSDFDRYSRYTVYQPSYPTYDAGYSDYSNGSPYTYSDDLFGGFESDGFDWKSLLFRSVISAFFSNGADVGYLDPSPQYTSSDDENYGYTGYIPRYQYQEPYYTFGSTPEYAYHEPAAYYGYDQYADATIPAEYIPQESLPRTDMFDIYSGGLAGEFIQRALGTGYYQGLLEGQMAKERGWDDEYYNDPYLYEQALYDPYSSSMGNCRRYMSEGYELGFRDALSGRDEFDLAETGGNIDLVSLLLGSALSLRG